MSRGSLTGNVVVVAAAAAAIAGLHLGKYTCTELYFGALPRV